MQTEDSHSRPTGHPEKQSPGTGGTPKFGRLLLVLFAAVLIVVAITFLSEAYYS